MTNNTKKSFKYGLISFILIILLIICIQFLNNNNSDIASLTIGLFILGIGITSINGIIYALRGLKEPNSLKKIIGLILNIGIVLLIASVMIANVIDIYRFLSN